MNLLLDTHTLLWFLNLDPRLSRTATSLISNGDNTLSMSAVSGYEIALKSQQGKLSYQGRPIVDVGAMVAGYALTHLPITLQHAQMAGAFELTHRDPFDRLLAAQSIIEDMPVVTADAAIKRLGARTLW